MVKGSCLCGAVRWRGSGELTPLTHCHCSMCRKAHGAPFASFTSCEAAEFAWEAGEDNIGTYESSPGAIRRFCRTCGSALPMTLAISNRVFMPAGCLDDDPGLRGGRHLFVASNPSWHTISDDLPKYEAYPVGPGIHADFPAIERPAAEAKSGVWKGSCLCGEVAFEVTGPFKVVHNCHCSRCRKARSAAHATNGFVAFDDVRFTRGEALVTHYKLPTAARFAQGFCSKCGSGVARKNPDAGIANVPLGALDDDPGQGPVDHIFVGSKADWWEITDSIKQFEEGPS